MQILELYTYTNGSGLLIGTLVFCFPMSGEAFANRNCHTTLPCSYVATDDEHLAEPRDHEFGGMLVVGNENICADDHVMTLAVNRIVKRYLMFEYKIQNL